MHGYAKLTDLDVEEVQTLTELLDTLDSTDYAVTETSLGLGIELWCTDYTERFK